MFYVNILAEFAHNSVLLTAVVLCMQLTVAVLCMQLKVVVPDRLKRTRSLLGW